MFSKDLLRSELFGAEPGSFTGASRRIVGAVERAQGGTLFLDEIGEVPLEVQPMLLRFLDRREFEQLGQYGRARRADVRVVAATNRDLRDATRSGGLEAALADFEEAVSLDETLVEIYVNRGSLYARLGNFGLAVGDFTLAVTLDPQNAIALNNRAVIHAIEGNYDLALVDLAQALSINPDDPQAYATRGAVYSALAARDYQSFLTASGSDQAALPAGTPAQVLSSVDDSLRTGNFGVWLALLKRGQ
jgi:tetratricopeptide (TPR) repeat protein